MELSSPLIVASSSRTLSIMRVRILANLSGTCSIYPTSYHITSCSSSCTTLQQRPWHVLLGARQAKQISTPSTNTSLPVPTAILSIQRLLILGATPQKHIYCLSITVYVTKYECVKTYVRDGYWKSIIYKQKIIGAGIHFFLLSRYF